MRQSTPNVPLGKYGKIAKIAAKGLNFFTALLWCGEKACGEIELAEKHTTLGSTHRLLNPEFIRQVKVLEAHMQKLKDSPDTYQHLIDAAKENY